MADGEFTLDFLNPDDKSQPIDADIRITIPMPGDVLVYQDTREYCKECRADLGGAHEVHFENKHLPTCSQAPWPQRVEYRISEIERRIEALESAAEARDDG